MLFIAGLRGMVLTLISTCKYIYRINADTIEVTLQPLSGDLSGQELGFVLCFTIILYIFLDTFGILPPQRTKIIYTPTTYHFSAGESSIN